MKYHTCKNLNVTIVGIEMLLVENKITLVDK